MSSYVNEIRRQHPAVFENKQKLHAEFLQKGSIQGAVSVLYYPLKHGPGTHTQLVHDE